MVQEAKEEVAGRVPDGTGLSSLRDEAATAASPKASIPSRGDWVLFRSATGYQKVAVDMKQAEKVTPRLVKFVGTHYPRQCGILEVVASFADKATAERVRDSIGGVAGEYERRRSAAQADLSARLTAAITAANQQVARLIAEAQS